MFSIFNIVKTTIETISHFIRIYFTKNPHTNSRQPCICDMCDNIECIYFNREIEREIQIEEEKEEEKEGKKVRRKEKKEEEEEEEENEYEYNGYKFVFPVYRL